MHVEYMSSKNENSVSQMPQRTSRTERRKKARKLARARRKAEIAKYLDENPTVKRFKFSRI